MKHTMTICRTRLFIPLSETLSVWIRPGATLAVALSQRPLASNTLTSETGRHIMGLWVGLFVILLLREGEQ